MTFDEMNEIFDKEVGVRETIGGRAASLHGDGGELEENSAAGEESSAAIDGKEVSVRFDDAKEIFDEEVKAIQTRGGRAASQRVDGGEHEKHSAAEVESTVAINGKEVSMKFNDAKEIFDGEV